MIINVKLDIFLYFLQSLSCLQGFILWRRETEGLQTQGETERKGRNKGIELKTGELNGHMYSGSWALQPSSLIWLLAAKPSLFRKDSGRVILRSSEKSKRKGPKTIDRSFTTKWPSRLVYDKPQAD